MLSLLTLSRLQFAVTITFHILYPAISIGLATYLLIVEGLWLKTRQHRYYLSARFFTKLLALTFGMGIISGLAMEFQLGTNWGGFSAIVGPVLGVLFILEALSAFFIEATFLGFMLFGWHKINEKFHFFCTFMVWVGVSLSAFWILAANSWMQTPAGVTFTRHHFDVNNWWRVILNPSTVLRYSHMMLAAYIATAMLIAAIACYYLKQKRYPDLARFNLRFALVTLIVCLPLQIILGDAVGLEVHDHQPIKTAAIEGLWHTTKGAPLVLFAKINQAKQRNEMAITIPHLASVINTHQWNGKLVGLTSVKPALQPPVAPVFYSFRIMVGLGFVMLGFTLYGLKLWRQGRLTTASGYHRLSMLLAPSGLIALITGWYTAEIGRQPWVVYGLVKTSDAVSHVTYAKVAQGFVVILITYGVLFGFYFMRYALRTITKGPQGE